MKRVNYLLVFFVVVVSLFHACKGDGDGFDPDLNGTFTDSRDDRTYNTITIGDITWMKENLKYDAGANSWMYENDEFYLESYGYLYNWETAQAVCPSGWELPTYDDWEYLANYVAEDQGDYTKEDDNYLNIAKYLKATSGWVQNNGTDNYGFQAYAGGVAYNDGTFEFTGVDGFWWTYDEYDDEQAYYRNMFAEDQTLYSYVGDKRYGFSVRCINRNFIYNDDNNDIVEVECSNELGSFTDTRNNITYKTTKICKQTWMAENLAYLPEISPVEEGSNYNPHYYVYDYNGTSVSEAIATDNYKTYGVLYNWHAAQNACPSGWHLPSTRELEVLEYYIYEDGYPNQQGIALKSDNGWDNDGNGTNEYHFTALPGGERSWDGDFVGMGFFSYYLTDSLKSDTGTIGYGYSSDTDGVTRVHTDKENGGYIRCIKD